MSPDRREVARVHPLRDTPWLRLAAAWMLACLTGYAGAWLIEQTGTWHDGARWEHALLAWAQTTASPALDLFFYALPFFGTNYTLAPVVAIAAVLLWRRGLKVSAVHIAVVQLGSSLLNPVLKQTLGRPRPEMYDPRGQHALAAYPSGHSIAVTAVLFTAAFLIHRNGRGTWGYWVAAFLFVVNNWSRIYLGVHWATDVIGGVAVGGVWLLLTILLFLPLHRRAAAG